MHENRDKVRVSVNTLVVKDNKVLLGKRAGKNGKGCWCSPGGHLEFGESAIEAAKRELREETGVEAQNISFIHVLNDPHCDNYLYHYIAINFLVDEWTGDPVVTEPDKFDEWKWFSVDELPTPMFSHHELLIKMWKESKVYQERE